MDLRGQSKIVTEYSYDEDLDVITVTFRDATEATDLGEMIIEGSRFRSMVDGISQVGRQLFPPELDLTTREKHRTLFSTDTKKATTEFT